MLHRFELPWLREVRTPSLPDLKKGPPLILPDPPSNNYGIFNKSAPPSKKSHGWYSILLLFQIDFYLVGHFYWAYLYTRHEPFFIEGSL